MQKEEKEKGTPPIDLEKKRADEANEKKKRKRKRRRSFDISAPLTRYQRLVKGD